MVGTLIVVLIYCLNIGLYRCYGSKPMHLVLVGYSI